VPGVSYAVFAMRTLLRARAHDGQLAALCRICYILAEGEVQQMDQGFTSLAELGREVARLRKAKGLTQRELGALVGMGQSTLARFETGRVNEFGARKLLRLLEVMGHGLTVTAERTPFTLDDALRVRRAEVSESSEPRR